MQRNRHLDGRRTGRRERHASISDKRPRPPVQGLVTMQARGGSVSYPRTHPRRTHSRVGDVNSKGDNVDPSRGIRGLMRPEGFSRGGNKARCGGGNATKIIDGSADNGNF